MKTIDVVAAIIEKDGEILAHIENVDWLPADMKVVDALESAASFNRGRRREDAGSEMGAQELSAHRLPCGCYTFERRSTDRYSARDSASVRSI